MIGNKTAIAKALQEYSISPIGEKTFETLYGNIALEGQKALSSLQTQFAEDVAAAYSAAELSKKNIMSSNLLTGAKEEEMDYLSNQLEEAYQQYKQKYLSDVASTEEAIAEASSAVTSLIDTEAENYYKLEQSFYPYLQALYKEQTEKGSTLFNEADWSKFVEEIDGEKRLKSWSDISKDFYSEEDGYKTLNKTGVDFYDQMLNAMENKKIGIEYLDWLQTYDKDGSLYEWATSYNPYSHIKDMGDMNRRIATFKDLYGMQSDDFAWSVTQEDKAAIKTHFNDSINLINSMTDEVSSLAEYSTLLDEYEKLKSGLTDEEKEEYEKLLYAGTETNYNNYYIQGLGSGRKNDDIDITIGANTRIKDVEYDLLVGDAVPENAVSTLNKFATGDPNKTPDEKKLIVVRNKMYIYTKKGWKYVVDDNKEGRVNDAIRALVGKQNYYVG